MSTQQKKNIIFNIKYHVILIPLFIIFSMPLLVAFFESIGNGGFSNYLTILADEKLGKYFLNSIIITLPVVILVLLIGSLTGYVFSKLKMPGKNLFFSFFLIGLMLPTSAIIVQLFMIIAKFGLVNNYFSIILPEVAIILPFALLILKNYMDDIPNEIIEAAKIDGCSNFRIYYMIILPLCYPALSSVTIFTFLISWNEYLLPLVLIRDPEMGTLTLIPRYFLAAFVKNISLTFTGFIIIIVPVIILFLVLQKYFVKGLTAGAIK